MQCLRLSAFEHRSRLDAQSDASLPCPHPLLARVRSGGSEDFSGGVVETADVVDEDGAKYSSLRPSSGATSTKVRVEVVVTEVEGEQLEPSCVGEGEGHNSCRRS